jgi:hypothetical protein
MLLGAFNGRAWKLHRRGGIQVVWEKEETQC